MEKKSEDQSWVEGVPIGMFVHKVLIDSGLPKKLEGELERLMEKGDDDETARFIKEGQVTNHYIEWEHKGGDDLVRGLNISQFLACGLEKLTVRGKDGQLEMELYNCLWDELKDEPLVSGKIYKTKFIPLGLGDDNKE